MARSAVMILDSNAFIESKNRFYAFDICPGFWDFVVEDFRQGNAMSIKHVRDELLVGEDDLSDWIEENLDAVSFYDCMADEAVVLRWQEVASYVRASYDNPRKPNIVNDFLKDGVADPWLVAYALERDGIVVTQERGKGKSKVSLTDVCEHFGVPHIDVFDFLRSEKARFVYDKPGGD